MKKMITIISSLLMIVLLSACTCGKKKPPHRAIYSQESGYGMQYHIILYQPSYGGATHSFRCGSWTYSEFHIYTDNLGAMKGDDVIWKNGGGHFDGLPFSKNGQQMHDINLVITKNNIQISGVKGNIFNGKYRVETSSPDSWGIRITR